jgi:glycosyltransferase involved in cell wall biosynthesis
MRSMVEALRLNATEVHLLCLNTRKHFRSSAEIEKHRPPELKLEYFNVNTDLKPLSALRNLLSRQAYHVSRFYQKSLVQRLEALLQAETFDIIQLEGLPMAVYLPLLRKYSKAPLLIRAHNIEYQIWERHLAHEQNPLRKLYLKLQVGRLKRFEKESLEAADAVVFISHQDQEIYRSWGGKSIANTTPCGLNPAEHPPISGTPPKYDVVHLASLDWLPNRQGAEWFLKEVWPLILEARPQTTMGFGGRDMPKEIIALGNQNLWLYPHVENARDFVAHGKVAVIPLLAGSGMRIKLLELLAWGMPTVSTSIGAEGIAIENYKEGILADDPESFAAAVVYLLDGKESRKEMQVQARQFFENHFDNRQLGADLLNFYRTLI